MGSRRVRRLVACATSTPYGPAEQSGGYGFSDQRIEENRYRITFRGNSSASRETVENFLLYRAAELTKEGGFDYFVLVESDTEVKTTYSGSSRNPAFYGHYSDTAGSRRDYYHFPYYPYGFGWAYSYDQYVHEITRYTAIAFVSMHRGNRPDDDPHAFDADQVLNNLQPYVLKDQN